jgi:hypothetical protein
MVNKWLFCGVLAAAKSGCAGLAAAAAASRSAAASAVRRAFLALMSSIN